MILLVYSKNRIHPITLSPCHGVILTGQALSLYFGVICMVRDLKATDRGIAFSLFWLLFACYLFTFTARIESSDGLSMFATVESMVRRGEVDSNQLLWMGLQQGSFGPDGELYSRKGLGAILLAWPLVWLAHLWPSVGLVQTAMLLNPLLTAWTGALLYRTGRRLGWQQQTALATALIFGLATLAWPYTQTFFSDPVCGWGLFAAFYGLLAYSQTGRKRYLLGCGVAWGLAYLTRTVNLVTLPIFVFGLLAALHHRHTVGNQPPRSPAALWRLVAGQWRSVVTFIIPIVSVGLLSLWWNQVRYGSIWTSGYVESESFSAPWLFGLFGLLVGPARGYFWYSPILLVGFFGLNWFRQQARWLFWMILTISVGYLLLYGKWYMWHGGYSWGPRFLTPILPFSTLLVGPVWERVMGAEAGQRWWRAGLWLLMALSIAVQSLGLLVPFHLVQDWLAARVEPLFAPETFTQLAYSPLVNQWRYLTTEHIQLAWWRATQATGTPDWQGVLLPLLGILVSLVSLVGYQRAGGEIFSRLYSWLHTFILIAITIALLLNYQRSLTGLDQRSVADRIEQLEQPGDAILYLRPTQSQDFADVYHGRLPTYGLMPQGALDEETQKWLTYLQNHYQRLWVVSDDTPPEQSGWERPLRIEDFLLQENRIPNTSNARLAVYTLARSLELTEAGLGLIFGDPAATGPLTGDEGWIRLQGYGLTAEVVPGDAIALELRWQSIRPVAQDYHVFVHLLDSRGEKAAQRDGQPVQWLRPISSWQPGEEILDHYGFLLPSDAIPGNYHIAVGLYDPVTGQRLPVSAGAGDFATELGPIQVKPR